jgi:hypothetical protein
LFHFALLVWLAPSRIAKAGAGVIACPVSELRTAALPLPLRYELFGKSAVFLRALDCAIGAFRILDSNSGSLAVNLGPGVGEASSRFILGKICYQE